MSADISQIKVEIKEWQRAHRRIHGRDPGKEELRKNPEMAAKYKIWQASLKAEKDKGTTKSGDASDTRNTASTPPKRAPKSILPKNMPVQSAAGPATPFSARKKQAAQATRSPTSPSPDQPSIPNPFSQSPSRKQQKVPALDFSASRGRDSSSKSARIVPFDSASSARHRPFPSLSKNLLDSDDDSGDEDDNPFVTHDPVSPTRARSRRSSQVVSPSKSVSRRRGAGSSALTTPTSSRITRSANLDLSPTRPKWPLDAAAAAMTPRTKARKRMRGEDVPATPGDKRRKLFSANATAADKPIGLFAEPSTARGTKRSTPADSEDEDDGEDEIIDSPKKKKPTVGVNGRVFTNMFDGEMSSPRKVTFAFSDADEDVASSRSTPPPPPSESGDSEAPDENEDAPEPSDDEIEPEPSLPSTSRTKPLGPVLPGRWTQDSWDAPTPGADLSHLRKHQFGKNAASDKGKGKASKRARRGSHSDDDADAKKQKELARLANPFELLPPIPGDEPPAQGGRTGTRYGNAGEGKSKGGKVKAADRKKLAKEVEAMEEEEEDWEEDAVNEIPWRPHGPLRAAPTTTPSSSQAMAVEDDDEETRDPAQNLPTDLRTLLSIHSTHREDIKVDALARDILAGRSTRVTEVWGVGDIEEVEAEGEGDWDSEPEGWTGGVEM
ncbi:hypothetical protein BDV93DRAFT_525806 [Ceratobasidium sp. AG-I]|nr:hypothetical protein BDV93DRAFT_525806 [Ceratobasidium sp. AG-I]